MIYKSFLILYSRFFLGYTKSLIYNNWSKWLNWYRKTRSRTFLLLLYMIVHTYSGTVSQFAHEIPCRWNHQKAYHTTYHSKNIKNQSMSTSHTGIAIRISTIKFPLLSSPHRPIEPNSPEFPGPLTHHHPGFACPSIHQESIHSSLSNPLSPSQNPNPWSSSSPFHPTHSNPQKPNQEPRTQNSVPKRNSLTKKEVKSKHTKKKNFEPQNFKSRSENPKLKAQIQQQKSIQIIHRSEAKCRRKRARKMIKTLLCRYPRIPIPIP